MSGETKPTLPALLAWCESILQTRLQVREECSHAQSPRLLAASEGSDGLPRALLLSALPGVPMERGRLSLLAEQAAGENAGRYLSAFHDLPLPDGTSPLSSEERALARDILQNAHAAFDDEPPVLCRRDFGPHNSLVDAQTGAWVGIIDFEHTRRDVRVSDFARFYEGAFLTRPDLEAAFWEGYGPWPDTAERFAAQLRLCRIVQALTQIKWARTHTDADFEAQGNAALARLCKQKSNLHFVYAGFPSLF